jgi:hypothetical protein
MVDLETLARRAERTAARSRVLMAARVGLPIAVLAFAAVAGGASIAACACVAVPLFVAGALLRWRNRIVVECVTAGLALGAVPARVALVLRCCGIECRGLPGVSVGEVLYLLATVLVGIGVTWRASHAPGARRQRWLATMLVASATAALGCVGMGVAALASTLLVVVAAASLALIPISVRTG